MLPLSWNVKASKPVMSFWPLSLATVASDKPQVNSQLETIQVNFLKLLKEFPEANEKNSMLSFKNLVMIWQENH